MSLAPHLLLERGHVGGIVRIPNRKWRPAAVVDGVRIGVINTQFLLRGFLVVPRQVAQEQERQHVVAEVVRVHRAAQLVGNGPEVLSELFLVFVFHCFDLFLILLSTSAPSSSSSSSPSFASLFFLSFSHSLFLSLSFFSFFLFLS